jgi:hypothetical protein
MDDAVCAVENWNRLMSRFYTAPTIITGFTDGKRTVSCYPQKCPCVRVLRRLLQTSNVSMQYWYPGTQQNSQGISEAIPNIILVQTVVEQSSSDMNPWMFIALLVSTILVLGILATSVTLFCIRYAGYEMAIDSDDRDK